MSIDRGHGSLLEELINCFMNALEGNGDDDNYYEENDNDNNNNNNSINQFCQSRNLTFQSLGRQLLHLPFPN